MYAHKTTDEKILAVMLLHSNKEEPGCITKALPMQGIWKQHT